MDTNSDSEKMEAAGLMLKKHLLEKTQQKGGFRTLPFIIANEAFERVASFGLSPNMIVYLMSEYHMDMVSGSNVLNLWTAATNFLPLLGAFLADSFLGRYPIIAIGSIFSLLGMILLWSTTIIPQARPPSCADSSSSCNSATIPQFIFLCFSFGLISVGAGGIRSSSLAFGADQLDKGDNSSKADALDSYFNWYYAVVTIAICISITCVVYIQENLGWQVGFGIPVALMIVSALSFFLASPFYIKSTAKTSLLTSFVQVIVASYKNRHFALSAEGTSIMYHHKEGSNLVVPSEKLRFLNKACIINDPEQYLIDGKKVSGSRSVCTVDEVEEFKAVLKVIPLWSTGVIMSVNVSQPSFPILQAQSMNRHISSTFEIPAASYGMFTIISVAIWVALYDRLILPLAARILRKPVFLTTKQRMGIGIFISFLSILSTAIIEYIRRGIAIKEGVSDDPQAVVHMSAMWLIIPNCLVGFAEAFNAVGQLEFYFSEFPRSMSSVASTLQGLGMCAGSLIAALIMNGVDHVSRSGGNPSWVSTNINEGHYDYYYMVLAGLCVVNFIYFLVCSWCYGPCEMVGIKISNETSKEVNESVGLSN